MIVQLTPLLVKAVESELDLAEKDNVMLDVYGVAGKIQAAHPSENVAVEDIVSALLAGRGGIGAIELAPRSGAMLEIILPGPASADALASDEEVARSPKATAVLGSLVG